MSYHLLLFLYLIDLLHIRRLTVQTMLMFLLAVFYDLQYPDDHGKCKTYSTESSCLNDKSLFSQHDSLCSWDGYECRFQSPIMSPRIVVLISILVGVLTAPVNLVVCTTMFLISLLICLYVTG